MKYKIKDLEKILEGISYGKNQDIQVTNFSSIKYATEKDIALAFTNEEKKHINTTKAKIIISNPMFMLETKKTFIFTCLSYENVITKLEKIFKQGTSIKNKQNINTTAKIHKSIKLPKKCSIGENVVIEKNSILGEDINIHANAVIKHGSILENNVVIDSGAIIGATPFWEYHTKKGIKNFQGTKGVKISEYSYIGSNTVIERGVLNQTQIGKNCRIGSSVTIGHDVNIGNNVRMVDQSGIAGFSSIGDNCLIFAQVGIMDNISIGNNVIIYAKSGVRANIPDNSTYSGTPAIEHKKNLRNLIILSTLTKRFKKEKCNEKDNYKE